jgi:hypothetical protein
MSFPKSQRSAGFRALDKVLRTDPVLQREVKLWRSWTGKPDDAADVSLKQCPAVTLFPKTSEGGWASNQEHEANITVDYSIYVKSTNIEDLFDFDTAVVAACYPSDPSRKLVVDELFRLANVSRPTFEAFGVDESVDGNDGAVYLNGSGSMTLTYYLETE